MSVDIDQALLELHVSEVLQDLALDGEHFADTPRRVAKMLQSFRQDVDLVGLLATSWTSTNDDLLIVQSDIPFKGLCAHHLLPFWGTAVVGYVPNGRYVGLSKLTRVVAAAGTRSPSTQEHITNSIADALMDGLHPIGAGVVSAAVHGCMAVRGVHAPTTVTRVSALRGCLINEPDSRAEFLALAR